MWNESQTTLLNAFFALAGIPHGYPKACEQIAVVCNDIAFTLLPALNAPTGVRVHAQFGSLPKGRTPAAMRRLLEVNLLMPSLYGEKLGIDPETGMVIFMLQLSAPTPQQLLTVLQSAAAKAKQWRLNFFLER